MKNKKIALWILVAGILLLLTVPTVLAGSQTIAGIAFNGPNTHQACPANGASQTVSITGLTNHQPSAQVQGYLKLYAITNGGSSRQLLQTYSVNSTKNVKITINYPPVSKWPINVGNTRELHVDVSINVMVGGTRVGVFDGNPNMGWDIYCVAVIHKPTPTRTPTQSPTVFPTIGFGNTPTPKHGGGTGPTSTPPVVYSTPTGVALLITPIPTPSTEPIGGANFNNLRNSMFEALALIGLFLIGSGLVLRHLGRQR